MVVGKRYLFYFTLVIHAIFYTLFFMQKKTLDHFTPAQQKVLQTCRDQMDDIGVTPQDFAALYADKALLPFDITAILRLLGLAAIVAGFFALLAMQWETMSTALRLLATLGPGVIGFGLAMTWQKRTETVDMLPFLLLILSSAALVTHGISEAMPWQNSSQFLGYAAASLPLLALLYMRQRAESLFATWFWLNTTMVSLAEWAQAPHPVILSLLAGINALWARSLAQSGHPRLAILADIVTLAALTMLIWDQASDLVGWNIILLAYGIGIMAIGMMTERRLLLLWGAVQIFASMIKYADFYFHDMLGWPFMIMGMGCILMILAHITRRVWPAPRP